MRAVFPSSSSLLFARNLALSSTSCRANLVRLCAARRPNIRSYTSHETLNSSSIGPGQSTVNPGEVAHFSKLSSLWWDEHGEFAQLHRMNPIRVQFMKEKLVSVYLARAPSYPTLFSAFYSTSRTRQKLRLRTI